MKKYFVFCCFLFSYGDNQLKELKDPATDYLMNAQGYVGLDAILYKNTRPIFKIGGYINSNNDIYGKFGLCIMYHETTALFVELHSEFNTFECILNLEVVYSNFGINLFIGGNLNAFKVGIGIKYHINLSDSFAIAPNCGGIYFEKFKNITKQNNADHNAKLKTSIDVPILFSNLLWQNFTENNVLISNPYNLLKACKEFQRLCKTVDLEKLDDLIEDTEIFNEKVKDKLLNGSEFATELEIFDSQKTTTIPTNDVWGISSDCLKLLQNFNRLQTSNYHILPPITSEDVLKEYAECYEKVLCPLIVKNEQGEHVVLAAINNHKITIVDSNKYKINQRTIPLQKGPNCGAYVIHLTILAKLFGDIDVAQEILLALNNFYCSKKGFNKDHEKYIQNILQKLFFSYDLTEVELANLLKTLKDIKKHYQNKTFHREYNCFGNLLRNNLFHCKNIQPMQANDIYKIFPEYLKIYQPNIENLTKEKLDIANLYAIESTLENPDIPKILPDDIKIITSAFFELMDYASKYYLSNAFDKESIPSSASILFNQSKIENQLFINHIINQLLIILVGVNILTLNSNHRYF